jgi:membrane protein implicated in regulation of membrane protease activity
MKDNLALLLCGAILSLAAWASWHWWSECISFAMIVVVLFGYAVDNSRLRRQVRSLLAERDRRAEGERKAALQRLTGILVVVRDMYSDRSR